MQSCEFLWKNFFGGDDDWCSVVSDVFVSVDEAVEIVVNLVRKRVEKSVYICIYTSVYIVWWPV